MIRRWLHRIRLGLEQLNEREVRALVERCNVLRRERDGARAELAEANVMLDEVAPQFAKYRARVASLETEIARWHALAHNWSGSTTTEAMRSWAQSLVDETAEANRRLDIVQQRDVQLRMRLVALADGWQVQSDRKDTGAGVLGAAAATMGACARELRKALDG